VNGQGPFQFGQAVTQFPHSQDVMNFAAKAGAADIASAASNHVTRHMSTLHVMRLISYRELLAMPRLVTRPVAWKQASRRLRTAGLHRIDLRKSPRFGQSSHMFSSCSTPFFRTFRYASAPCAEVPVSLPQRFFLSPSESEPTPRSSADRCVTEDLCRAPPENCSR